MTESKSSLVSYPIRGAYYRAPATAILNVLPAKAPLYLRYDPFGTVAGSAHTDPNAIAVYVKTESIPAKAHVALGAEAAGSGIELSWILAQPEHHLGYVPKEKAAELKLRSGDVPAELRILSSGDRGAVYHVCFDPGELGELTVTKSEL